MAPAAIIIAATDCGLMKRGRSGFLLTEDG